MKRLILLLTAAIILLLSGCDAAPLATTYEIETTAATTEPEPTPFPITINDTEITASPARIISVSPALTELLYEMGYGERLVGRSAYCDYPEAVTALPDMGSSADPDYGKIAELKPDLLLSAAPIPAQRVFELSQLGITTLVLPAPASLAELKREYELLGLLFEGAFTGSEVGDNAYKPLEDAISAAGIKLGSFVYITEGLTVAGGNTAESAFLTPFGSNLAQSTAGYAYDKSLLLETQPDVVLLNSRYTPEELSADETYSQLDAVKNEKVIVIDNGYFEKPTGRLRELVEKLRK